MTRLGKSQIIIPIAGFVATAGRYKSIDSFNLDEPCLVRFAHAIKNKNTIYYVLSYLKWAKAKGYWQSAQQMLDEYEALGEKERLTHFNRLKEYLESKGTGSNDRRNTWFAVSRFYRFEHDPRLPAMCVICPSSQARLQQI
jgi:hypothetical protein